MRIVFGLSLLNLILQAESQLFFPAQFGTGLQGPLYLGNIRCRQCKQPLQTLPSPALEPAQTLPDLSIRGMSDILAPRAENTDEGPQIEISQEEEVIIRSQSDIEKFLSERGSNSSLLRNLLKERKGRQNGAKKISKLVESLSQTDRSTPVDRVDDEKALECAQIECGLEEMRGPLCACNFKTGNTVSFKNACDLKKHNCRFNTGFKTILDEICPWQFVSRSGSGGAEHPRINYDDSRYYNK